LRQLAHQVPDPTSPDVAAVVKDLTDTLAHWRTETGYGRAIAAPQIGVSSRIVLIHLPGSEPWPFINPTITATSEDTRIVWDLCLSFLCIAVQVERSREVTVRYQDLTGTSHEIQAGDDRDLSELLQHEIDHLNGILTVDRMRDVKSLCTREEFEKRFRATSPYATVEA
jgi:peptide deformylase